MNHRKYSIIFLFLLLASLLSAQDRGFVPKKSDGSQERRIALVIGNNTYQKSGMSLKNAGNDAQDMGKALQELGFDVILKQNLDYQGIKSEVLNFTTRLKSYDVGLVYYSGHGVSYQNKNYIVPTDANIETEAAIDVECYELNKLLTYMEASNVKNSLVFLDACRNNIYTSNGTRSLQSKGLVAPYNPHGTYIVYATQEGRTASDNPNARNGLFTASLLKSIKTPDLTLKQIIDYTKKEVREKSDGQQLPNAYDQIEGDFYFLKTIKGHEKPSAELLDSDRDGILNKFDKCPNEYGSIENKGCPDKTTISTDKTYVENQISKAIRFYDDKKYTESFTILNQYKHDVNMTGEGLNYLGYMYQKGYGVSSDEEIAVILYKKSAEKGNARGQCFLGDMYRSGFGINQNYKDALYWYRKAAEQGNSDAQTSIGSMYLSGNGVEKNFKEAIIWFRKSAELGDANGQFYMGHMYHYGFGINQNFKEAIFWYQKSCNNGNIFACSTIKEIRN